MEHDDNGPNREEDKPRLKKVGWGGVTHGDKTKRIILRGGVREIVKPNDRKICS